MALIQEKIWKKGGQKQKRCKKPGKKLIIQWLGKNDEKTMKKIYVQNSEIGIDINCHKINILHQHLIKKKFF